MLLKQNIHVMTRKTGQNRGLFRKLKKIVESAPGRIRKNSEKTFEKIQAGNLSILPQQLIAESKQRNIQREMRKGARLACSFALNKIGLSGKQNAEIRSKVHRIMQMPAVTSEEFQKRRILLQRVLGKDYEIFLKQFDFFIRNGGDIIKQRMKKSGF